MKILMATFNSKTQRKAIKLTAEYYLLDSKKKMVEGQNCIELSSNENSINITKEIVKESIKDYYMAICESKKRK